MTFITTRADRLSKPLVGSSEAARRQQRDEQGASVMLTSPSSPRTEEKDTGVGDQLDTDGVPLSLSNTETVRRGSHQRVSDVAQLKQLYEALDACSHLRGRLLGFQALRQS